ncbi:hypothetical protein ENBRE01_2238 [Enteropsectra breve]|nr:hypothetical protein ENBRE01_2238 [Enteropsectra breve]
MMLAINILLSISPILGIPDTEERHFLKQTYFENSNSSNKLGEVDTKCTICCSDLRENSSNIELPDKINRSKKDIVELRSFKDLNPEWMCCTQCNWVGHTKCCFKRIVGGHKCMKCWYPYHCNIRHILLFEILMIFLSRKSKANFFEFLKNISPELESVSIFDIILYSAKMKYLVDHPEVSRRLISYLSENKLIDGSEVRTLSVAFIEARYSEPILEPLIDGDSIKCKRIVHLANFIKYLSSTSHEIDFFELLLFYGILDVEDTKLKLLYIEEMLDRFICGNFPLETLDDYIECITGRKDCRDFIWPMEDALFYVDEDVAIKYFVSTWRFYLTGFLLNKFSDREPVLKEILKAILHRKMPIGDDISPLEIIEAVLEKKLQLSEEETLEVIVWFEKKSNAIETEIKRKDMCFFEPYLKKFNADFYNKVVNTFKECRNKNFVAFVLYAMPEEFFDSKRIYDIMKILKPIGDSMLERYLIDILVEMKHLVAATEFPGGAIVYVIAQGAERVDLLQPENAQTESPN